MATISTNIHTDAEIKRQAEELFAEFGLTVNTAVDMFLRQSVKNRSIPLEFLSGEEKENSRQPICERKKSIEDLFGKIHFAEGYDHKALREGRA